MDRLVNNRGWYQYEQVDYDTGEVIGGIVELQMTEYQVKVEAHKDWEEMMDKYGPMGRGSETLGAKLFGKNGQMAVLFMFGGGLTPGGRLTPGVPRPGKGAAKLSPNFKTPTNPPQPPPETIPDGWNLRIQVNGEPGTAPGYEDFGGYWILTNSEGHPVNPGNGMKTASGRETYHVPLPKGWTRPK